MEEEKKPKKQNIATHIVQIRETDEKYINESVNVLRDAFDQNSLHRYFFADHFEEYEKSLFEWILKKAVKSKGAFLEAVINDETDEVISCALWFNNEGIPSDWFYFSAGFWKLLRHPKISYRITKYGAIADQQHHSLTKDKNHHYLLYIGTSSKFLGLGLATLLIRYHLQKVDEEGVYAYLEATSNELVGLYSRFGFELLYTFHDESSKPIPDTFFMLRNRQSHNNDNDDNNNNANNRGEE